MDFVSPITVALAYLLLGVLYYLLARRFIELVTYQMTGEIKPGLFQIATVVLTWPISLVLLAFVSLVHIVKNWSMFKAATLGYWPLVAHAANTIGHWRSIRETVYLDLDSKGLAHDDACKRLQEFDMHVAELEYCLQHQFRMKLEFRIIASKPEDVRSDSPQEVDEHANH